jgi:protein-disulfide isomerase
MRKSPRSSASVQWPIRPVILGAMLFAAGFAAGYIGRDLPSLFGGGGGDAARSASAKDDPSWGPSNAKVVVVAFGDFECPYCRQWFANVYDRLEATYGDTIRFIHRDFPLPMHANARPAAMAANCANEQGRYWEYFRLLYSDPRGLGSAVYPVYAQETGLDLASFNSCLASNKYSAEIDLDMNDAERLGVSGVPAFFINDRLISGAQPFDAFRQAIEEELSQ